jgi:CRISPR/Cas system-associated exonuclease Cas4 (RecB family)
MSKEIDHATRAHHPLGGSRWPALSKCGHYEYQGNWDTDRVNGEWAKIGTAIHEAVEKYFLHGDDPAENNQLEPDHIEQAEWLINQAKMVSGDIQLERKLIKIDDEFETEYFTTADLIAPAENKIVDFKTGRQGDYYAQLCAMALPLMEEWNTDTITGEIWYSMLQFKQKYTLTREACEKVYELVKKRVKEPPRACEKCETCKLLASCPGPKAVLDGVLQARDDWKLENYHSSKITDPDEMSKALDIAQMMKKWCEAVNYHATKLIGDGKEIPGYTMGTRAGAKYITDIILAKDLLPMTDEEFMRLCTISLDSLSTGYASKRGLSKPKAKKEIEKYLTEVIDQKRPTFNIKKIK